MAGVSNLVSFLRQGEGQPPTSYLVPPLVTGEGGEMNTESTY